MGTLAGILPFESFALFIGGSDSVPLPPSSSGASVSGKGLKGPNQVHTIFIILAGFEHEYFRFCTENLSVVCKGA
jgi:hypothetical protein